MRTLHVFHGANLVNGVDRATLTLCEALRAQGVAVHALVPEDGPVLAELGRLSIPAEIAPLGCCESLAPRARLKFFANAGRRIGLIEELIVRWGIDLVHANTGHLVDAAIAAALRPVPLLWHVHSPIGIDHARYAPHLDLAGYGALLGGLSSRVLTVSEDMHRSLAEHVPPAQITVLPNGVDVAALETAARRPGRSVRTELGLPAASPLILGVGRVSAQKDFATFARVAAAVARSGSDAHFLIAGPFEEPPAVRELRETIAANRLEDRVHLLGPRDDVPRLLLEANVVLSTAAFEGQGISTIEAMALARPVVAMACAGLRECVTDGVDGLLVPLGDVDACAAAVLRLLRDRELAERLGKSARATVGSRFSRPAFGKAFLRIATEAAAAGVPPLRTTLARPLKSLLGELAEADDRVRRHEIAGSRSWLDRARGKLAR